MKKLILLLSTLTLLLLSYAPTWAQEDDPVTQCVRGIELFNAHRDGEAFPLLEAGFNARTTTTFSDPNDLGYCAIILGWLRDVEGDSEGALEAYYVSLDIFQQTGER